jgi:hypothetical protein
MKGPYLDNLTDSLRVWYRHRGTGREGPVVRRRNPENESYPPDRPRPSEATCARVVLAGL